MVAQIDVLSRTVGDFGPWQITISILMSLLKMPIAWFQLSILILEAPTVFWCTEAEGLTWKNESELLREQNTGKCFIYLNDTKIEGNVSESGVTVPCTDWEYDRSIFTENIVTQWNLVCDRKHYSDIAQAIFMFGVLLGNVVFGMAADRFGRKPPLIVAIGLQCVCGIASAFTTWFIAFLFFRFLLAIATGGTMIASFVLLMEIVGDSWRTTVSILYQIPFPFGVLMMTAVSYVERDWRYFHLILSIISGFFFIYWWIIPESPRWLLAVGREEDAAIILEEAAHKNGRDIKEVRKVIQYQRMVKNQNPAAAQNRQANIMDLLRTPNIRKNSICVFIAWFVCGLSFFAMSQLMGRIGGNIFINISTAGAIGIPGAILAIYAVKFGRKKALISAFIVAGITCFVIAFIPKGMFVGDWPRLALSAVAIVAMTLAFPAIYLFSGEIFPTVIRNIGLGAASMFSRVGSILAPFVKSLDSEAEYLPMVIIGISVFIGAVTCYILPETKDCKLPDSIQDGERLGKSIQLGQSTQEASKPAENISYELSCLEINSATHSPSVVSFERQNLGYDTRLDSPAGT